MPESRPTKPETQIQPAIAAIYLVHEFNKFLQYMIQIDHLTG